MYSVSCWFIFAIINCQAPVMPRAVSTIGNIKLSRSWSLMRRRPSNRPWLWYTISTLIKVTSEHFWEKAMAPHSSTLAWKIPWMEEPGGLQSRGSRRVRHDWVTSLSLFTFLHWRRKWQPTPVFLPGESQGRGSLVGCCLWGRTELDTTEAT